MRLELNCITEYDIVNILTKQKNALIKQYQAMLSSENVKIEFSEEAILEIARIAAEVNSEVENIGARRLHTILSSLLEELIFAVPADISTAEITNDEI